MNRPPAISLRDRKLLLDWRELELALDLALPLEGAKPALGNATSKLDPFSKPRFLSLSLSYSSLLFSFSQWKAIKKRSNFTSLLLL